MHPGRTRSVEYGLNLVQIVWYFCPKNVVQIETVSGGRAAVTFAPKVEDTLNQESDITASIQVILTRLISNSQNDSAYMPA